jgi:glycosyltransferase involved in cell wall biosynthesis
VRSMARLLTTVPHEFVALTPERLGWWRERATVVDRREHSRLGYVRTVVHAAAYHDAVLLDGSIGARELYADLVIAGLIGRRTKRIVISDATWKRGGPVDRMLMGAGLRWIDTPRTLYCELSIAELRTFPRSWEVDTGRVVFTPFCFTLTEDELMMPTSEGGGVFAGGDSMRDYTPLLEVAPGLPSRVTISSVSIRTRSQGNLTVARVAHEEFNRQLRAASVVVVPLARTERSAGQQTYLNAMALGNLVVDTDAPRVGEYVEDGVSVLVYPGGEPRALAEAISWALDPANAIAADRIRAAARVAAYAQYSPDAYFQRISDVAERGVQTS